MQAMDEEPEPNWMSITTKTTGLDVEPRPAGGAGPRVELLLRLAMMECHTWLGIGRRSGRVRRPRRLSRKRRLAVDDNDDCRVLIGQEIKNSLSNEKEYDCLTPANWDMAVPFGLELDLAMAVPRAGGGAFTVIVDISVTFEFVYSEAQELLLACDENDDGGGLAGTGRSGDGKGPSCSICFEDMSREDDEVTDLPGCTHSFHRRCIAAWFYKASTCPVCRRDQFQYLPLDYQDLHDSMTIDPDSLQDYL